MATQYKETYRDMQVFFGDSFDKNNPDATEWIEFIDEDGLSMIQNFASDISFTTADDKPINAKFAGSIVTSYSGTMNFDGITVLDVATRDYVEPLKTITDKFRRFDTGSGARFWIKTIKEENDSPDNVIVYYVSLTKWALSAEVNQDSPRKFTAETAILDKIYLETGVVKQAPTATITPGVHTATKLKFTPVVTDTDMVIKSNSLKYNYADALTPSTIIAENEFSVGDNIEIGGLTTATEYVVNIIADFDLNDGAGLQTAAVIGTSSMTTA